MAITTNEKQAFKLWRFYFLIRQFQILGNTKIIIIYIKEKVKGEAMAPLHRPLSHL